MLPSLNYKEEDPKFIHLGIVYRFLPSLNYKEEDPKFIHLGIVYRFTGE